MVPASLKRAAALEPSTARSGDPTGYSNSTSGTNVEQAAEPFGHLLPSAERCLGGGHRPDGVLGALGGDADRVARAPCVAVALGEFSQEGLGDACGGFGFHRPAITWVKQTSQPPAFESEALVRVLFADHGSLEDLRNAIAEIHEYAHARSEALLAQGLDYLDSGGPFPDRLHLLHLVGGFLGEHYAAMLR